MRLRNEPFDLAIEDLNKIPLFLPFWSPAPALLIVHHLFGRSAFEAAPFPIAAATWLFEKAIPSAYRNLPIVAVSASTREDLGARGMNQDRIEVIENGVDPIYFSPGEEEMRYPLPTVLFLGRLRRYKRVDLILKALALLKGRGVRAHLLIAGEGDEEQRLKDEARTLNFSDDEVRFLGFVSEEEKVELLQRAWVHILTSPKEGWGSSIVDAAACGTPTVASDAPGLRDSVRQGETGFLVGHGDVEALAERIQLLVQDGDLRRRMGLAAREFAEGLSWERTSDQMAGVLARAAS
jgi:glycosyltransferase involved in cell wall biosynthesis